MSGFDTTENIYTHVQVCRDSLVNPEVYNNFKRNTQYTKILEHCPYNIAALALRTILHKYGTLLPWNEISKNDSIGNPIVYDFKSVFDEFEMAQVSNYIFSATTIAYVYQAMDILTHYNEDLNIVEIGGGYGGLCYILHVLLYKFRHTRITSYTIIDIPDVGAHQKKYLQDMGLPLVNIMSCHTIIPKDYDLCISIYALGEFTRSIIDNYNTNVLSRCKNVYFWWNISHVPEYFNTHLRCKTELNIDGVDDIIYTLS